VDRDYIVTVLGEQFNVTAPDGDYLRARWLGCRAYLRRHPNSSYKITSLKNLGRGKVKVRVVDDRRIKFGDFF